MFFDCGKNTNGRKGEREREEEDREYEKTTDMKTRVKRDVTLLFTKTSKVSRCPLRL